MKHIVLFTLLLLAACVKAPTIVIGKGAVYGILSADAHPDFKKKMLNANNKASSAYGSNTNKGINYKDNMVNYSKLKELYVGLVSADYSPQQHQLWVTNNAISPRSLALSPNDSLHIHNNTAMTQHFFITQLGSEDGFQSFPELKAGQNAVFTLKLEGHLELLSEDNNDLKTHLFSKKNMLSQQLSSGQRYQFEGLNPGDYQLIFWYWRLGEIKQAIQINAQKNLHINKTLTVKSVMQSN